VSSPGSRCIWLLNSSHDVELVLFVLLNATYDVALVLFYVLVSCYKGTRSHEIIEVVAMARLSSLISVGRIQTFVSLGYVNNKV
jgi:hypothetical protein